MTKYVYFKWTKKSAYFKFYIWKQMTNKGDIRWGMVYWTGFENKKDCNGANVRKIRLTWLLLSMTRTNYHRYFGVAQDKWFTFDLINFLNEKTKIDFSHTKQRKFQYSIHNPMFLFLNSQKPQKEQLLKYSHNRIQL